MLSKAALTLASALAVDTSPVETCDTPLADEVEMYPTTEAVPENLLRIYLYFPFDVRTQNVLDHISLVDSSGVEIEGVFLANRFDLVSPDRRRVTLLLDPGRVKTGLAAHNTLGRAIEAGKTYRLLVRHTGIGALSCSERPASFQFSVTAADDVPPSPEDWELLAPAAGTREPLAIGLGSAHDHLSLAYRLRIRTRDGQALPGRIELGAEEKSWRFTPSDPWPAMEFVLSIDERLEDLAGNRPGVLFDQPIDAQPDPWQHEIHWAPTSVSATQSVTD